MKSETKLISLWFAFLVEDQASVNRIRSVVCVTNSRNALLHVWLLSVSTSLVQVVLTPSHRPDRIVLVVSERPRGIQASEGSFMIRILRQSNSNSLTSGSSADWLQHNMNALRECIQARIRQIAIEGRNFSQSDSLSRVGVNFTPIAPIDVKADKLRKNGDRSKPIEHRTTNTLKIPWSWSHSQIQWKAKRWEKPRLGW